MKLPSILPKDIECNKHYILLHKTKQGHINLFKVQVLDFTYYKDYSIDYIIVRKHRFGTAHLPYTGIKKKWALLKYYI